MLRGTRIIEGIEASILSDTINAFKNIMYNEEFSEVIIPSIWEQETFTKKAGKEIERLGNINIKQSDRIKYLEELVDKLQNKGDR